jgi:hypothetical protein
MPRIPDRLQRSIVFIYPDAETAEAGVGAGGTGFLVAVSGIARPQPFIYLVTNMHVACSEGRCLRVRTINGDYDIARIDGADWVGHPDGDDVAVCQIERKSTWDIDAIVWKNFAATRPRLQELNVGVGDEIFMLGRFVGHQGKMRLQPLARFGNIAMMPGERVRDGRGFEVEAFLTEMRSLSGFSGSPVFVYLGPGTYRGSEDGRMMPFYSETIGLIGVDSGHKCTRAQILDLESGCYLDHAVDLNTGVSLVVPVWKIEEVLNDDRLVAIRGGLVRE